MPRGIRKDGSRIMSEETIEKIRDARLKNAPLRKIERLLSGIGEADLSVIDGKIAETETELRRLRNLRSTIAALKSGGSPPPASMSPPPVMPRSETGKVLGKAIGKAMDEELAEEAIEVLGHTKGLSLRALADAVGLDTDAGRNGLQLLLQSDPRFTYSGQLGWHLKK